MKNITLDGVEYTPVIKKNHKRITQTLDFEVYPYNSLDKMSWDDAKKACAELGKGWRLPTRIELILMFETQLFDFEDINYWSSTECNKYFSWYQSFTNGYQNFDKKSNANYVHPVRDVRTFSLTSGSGTTAHTDGLNTVGNINNTVTQDRNVTHTYTNL